MREKNKEEAISVNLKNYSTEFISPVTFPFFLLRLYQSKSFQRHHLITFYVGCVFVFGNKNAKRSSVSMLILWRHIGSDTLYPSPFDWLLFGKQCNKMQRETEIYFIDSISD